MPEREGYDRREADSPGTGLKDNVTITKGPSGAAKVLEAALSCVGGTMVGDVCQCNRGEVAKRFSDRTICMPGLGSIDKGGGSAAKVMQPATIPLAPPPPVTASCTGGRLGTPPNCFCPQGTEWTGRACLQIVNTPPPNPSTRPANPCRPGYVVSQGRCVEVGFPRPKMMEPTVPFDWTRRPPKPPTNVGGTDGTGKTGPAPTPLPPSLGGTIPPGNIRPGGSPAVEALRCQ